MFSDGIFYKYNFKNIIIFQFLLKVIIDADILWPKYKCAQQKY